jgi:hypothetical protein
MLQWSASHPYIPRIFTHPDLQLDYALIFSLIMIFVWASKDLVTSVTAFCTGHYLVATTASPRTASDAPIARPPIPSEGWPPLSAHLSAHLTAQPPTLPRRSLALMAADGLERAVRLHDGLGPDVRAFPARLPGPRR